MADKKINELLLIDEATDDVSFAGDDGVQTYRVTGAQIKAYIDTALKARLDAIEADNWVTGSRITDGTIAAGKVNVESRDKIVQMNISSNVDSAGNIAILSRNDLTIGKSYELVMVMRFVTNDTHSPGLEAYCGGGDVGTVTVDINPSAATVQIAVSKSTFTAAGTDLTVNAVGLLTSSRRIIGGTMVIIRECNMTRVVSGFA